MEVILKLRRHFSVTVQHKYCTCVINYANGVQIGIYPNHALNSEDAFRAASLRVSSHRSMPRRKLYKYNRTGTRLAVLILVTDRWALELGSQQVSQRAHSTGNGTSPRPVDYDEQRPQGSSHFTISQ